ncbi:MAG: 4-hydroxy-tetrahydrodipicolinate synthase [Verrucomicrobiota bacterium]|nr:4-hydroxy-tetrahydrodipicolinate synthase [Verrucomicrobiota bacterium]
MFEGAHTAIVTPFNNNNVDEKSLRELIDFQFNNGISGIVPCGTTGESPTLTASEHKRIIEISVEASNDRGLVIAGTGSNCTHEAIEMTQFAEAVGANAALLVCPYYNKPSQEGLFQHYRAIANETTLPIMLYSIPGRSVIEISVETQARLHQECPNICAMKEAGGDVNRVVEILEVLPSSYEVLSGDDALTLSFMNSGAVGVVSVASNIIPSQLASLVSAVLNGKTDEAEKINAECKTLFEGLLGLDTNPIPIKEAMALTGKINNELRLPLVGLSDNTKTNLVNLLSDLGLIQI